MKEDALAIKVESYRDLSAAIKVLRSQVAVPVSELVEALKSGRDLLLADDWFRRETDEQEQWLQFLLRLKVAGVSFAVLLREGSVDLAFMTNLINLHRQIDLDGEMQKQLELGEWTPELEGWVRQQLWGPKPEE